MHLNLPASRFFGSITLDLALPMLFRKCVPIHESGGTWFELVIGGTLSVKRWVYNRPAAFAVSRDRDLETNR